VAAYIDVVNKTGREPAIGKLEPLATPGCKSCRNYEQQVATLSKNNEHFSRNVASLSTPLRTTSFSPSSAEVFVTMRQSNATLLDSHGKTIQQLKPGKATFDFALKWISASWKIDKIYDVN
jgi:hypothetical protein